MDQDLRDGPAPVVNLLLDGDRAVACGMRRAPERDRPGCTYWAASPLEPVQGTFRVQVVSCPPHTGFYVDVPPPGPGDMPPDQGEAARFLP